MDEKKALRQIVELKRNSRNMRLAAEKWDSDFKTLIAIILSARTKDETTIRVAKNLFLKYPTPQKLKNADLKDVMNLIRPVNFYKNKSRLIILCARELTEKYKNKVPRKLEELIKLPGVGRKTANVFLSEIGQDAIGVDTHVGYISRKLRWTKSKKPADIERDLKKLFSKKNWKKINPILVRFGKTYTNRKKKDEILNKIRRM